MFKQEEPRPMNGMIFYYRKGPHPSSDVDSYETPTEDNFQKLNTLDVCLIVVVGAIFLLVFEVVDWWVYTIDQLMRLIKT